MTLQERVVALRTSLLKLRVSLLAKAGRFDESKHRRHPKGHPQGGRFAPKGGGFENRGDYSRARNPKAFDQLVRDMGYDNTADFESTTGVTFDELKGKWFTVSHNRVFLKAGYEDPVGRRREDNDFETSMDYDKAFDESKHRRRPKGHPDGGKFAPKGGGIFAGTKLSREVRTAISAQLAAIKDNFADADPEDLDSGDVYEQTFVAISGFIRDNYETGYSERDLRAVANRAAQRMVRFFSKARDFEFETGDDEADVTIVRSR